MHRSLDKKICKQTCQLLKVQNLETFIFFSKKPGDSGGNREIFVFDKFFSKNKNTNKKRPLFLQVLDPPTPAIYNFHRNQNCGDKNWTLKTLYQIISLIITVFPLFLGVSECLFRCGESL